MKLIGSLTSPFVRKVRIVLAEKKIEYDFALDSPWTPETNVIAEYLDNVAPNNKLMPAQNRERTEVKRWEALADGLCDAAALIFLEKKRPAKEQGADWITRQEDKINRSIDYMSEHLGENGWCTNTHFTLADIATGCALGYLAFRFPEITWGEKHPNLARLYAKLMLRPAFAETVPQG